MTANELARSYLQKATVRLEMLSFLHARGAWSDVVREAQEMVELALKAMLRQAGLDPPKWHDVGPILLEEAQLFAQVPQTDLERLAAISKRLRKEREFAFYGDIDFIPTREYDSADSEQAITDAAFVLSTARGFIEGST